MSLPEVTLQKLDWDMLFIFHDILLEAAVHLNRVHYVIKVTGKWVQTRLKPSDFSG
jgi:hypothetical protein